MTTPDFRIYGCPRADMQEVAPELAGVSLCFLSAKEMRAFARFVMSCADEAEKDGNWDHGHFIGKDEHDQNIVLALLDERNY
ncbi:hypothetical protein RA19_10755 [Leisingera sp. ANG-M1]|uniref:hypothetical protein n=1 Tax=Leisingera sp. ANG-M1 TaxID=1577895 RepID=UPI00057F14E9|nr:hypothetical protein [Leisingera sp. ANG-M1]KIC10618.1 hypothetical protein RA19_10755 [Leisingera sp. ANG-M1]